MYAAGNAINTSPVVQDNLLLSASKKEEPWVACLARIFEVYPLLCPKCNLEMKPVAVTLNDKELVRLLTHMGLPV